MDRLVSIVLPVYNGQKYISGAIDSILQQSYKNIELIIVNDCSTDSTLEILKEYEKKDARIRIVNNPQNMKLPKSLNIGFREANGDYFTWTSDDNMFKLDAIEIMVQFLENNEADMVNANCIAIDENGTEIEVIQQRDPQNVITGNRIGACFLYTRKIAEKVGEYDPLFFLAEDYDYWIRISLQGKIDHIDENLYYYRKHGNSLTETKKLQVGIQTARVLEKYFLRFYFEARNMTQRHYFYAYLLRMVKDSKEEYARYHKMIVKIDPSYLIRELWWNITNPNFIH